MTVVDQLRRGAQAGAHLAELVGLLTGDDLEGEDLYRALEGAVERAQAFLDAPAGGTDVETQTSAPPPDAEYKATGGSGRQGEGRPGPPVKKVEKYCPRCKQTKPVAEFGRNRASHDGLQSYCKPCGTAVDREHRARKRKAGPRQTPGGSPVSKTGGGGSTPPRGANGNPPRERATPAVPPEDPGDDDDEEGEMPPAAVAELPTRAPHADGALLAPIPPRDPITVTVACPAHGDLAVETYGGGDSPDTAAKACGVMHRLIHEYATGCTERARISWRPGHRAEHASGNVVRLRQPGVAS